jgi:hypothetical protein
VLLARDAQRAVRLLTNENIRIHSVAIRAGLSGQEEVEMWSLRCGAKPWTFRSSVNDRSVVLEGLDTGADWESPALES